MQRLCRSLITGSALAGSAFARDVPVFTGPHVEATLGYDHGDDDQSIDGLPYGGGIGYDIATSGGLVPGVEGGITGSTARNSQGQ